MKSKILSGLFLGTFWAAAMHAEGTIGQRKENQQERIAAGVKSGQLTPKETVRLEKKQANLNREIRRERKANGGNLTNNQKKQVARQQNHASKSIYAQKHDAQQTK